MAKKYDFDTLVDETITNIRDDRDRGLGVLNEVQKWINSGASERMSAGAPSMAKLLEVIQRSNEQLVKLVALKIKERNFEDEQFTDKDRETLFEQIADDGQ